MRSRRDWQTKHVNETTTRLDRKSCIFGEGCGQAAKVKRCFVRSCRLLDNAKGCPPAVSDDVKLNLDTSKICPKSPFGWFPKKVHRLVLVNFPISEQRLWKSMSKGVYDTGDTVTFESTAPTIYNQLRTRMGRYVSLPLSMPLRRK